MILSINKLICRIFGHKFGLITVVSDDLMKADLFIDCQRCKSMPFYDIATFAFEKTIVKDKDQ